MVKGVRLVRSAFKEQANVIERLASRDEGFRDMCDDFQTANDEKLLWERSTPGPNRSNNRPDLS